MDDNGRYARQIALTEIGAAGQRRLAGSAVLVVGAGALGTHAADLLARAGVGRLVIVDRDVVELSNLQRQTLYTEEDARERRPKAEAAAGHLRSINTGISLTGVVAEVGVANVARLVADVDLVVDGTDNFATRFLLNDACVAAHKPWVYCGVQGTAGTVLAIMPGRGPCLRCLLDVPAGAADAGSCEAFGVLGPTVALVAAAEVAEALHLLVDPTGHQPRVLTVDPWRGRYASVALRARRDCPTCADRRFDFLDKPITPTTTVLCGRNAVQVGPSTPHALDLSALASRLGPRAELRGLVLEAVLDDHRLVVFADGRVLVMGTTDPEAAERLARRVLAS